MRMCNVLVVDVYIYMKVFLITKSFKSSVYIHIHTYLRYYLNAGGFMQIKLGHTALSTSTARVCSLQVMMCKHHGHCCGAST